MVKFTDFGQAYFDFDFLDKPSVSIRSFQIHSSNLPSSSVENSARTISSLFSNFCLTLDTVYTDILYNMNSVFIAFGFEIYINDLDLVESIRGVYLDVE